MDDLCNKILNELDLKKQADLMRQLGDFYYREYWTMPLVYGNILFASSAKVKEYPVFPRRSPVLNLEYLTMK
ncbi:MAG: hypothetical protein HYU29_09125 [Chloroflexi bacterium]|nr:hypothetical protein [Chloroflexota bacterium]